MRSAIELAVNIALTKEFIAADYTDIVLHTRTRIQGGDDDELLVDGPDRASQRFRLIPQRLLQSDLSAKESVTEEDTAAFIYILMGKHDAEMDQYDWWIEPSTGQLLQVIGMQPANGYERKALINIYNRRK